MTLPIQNNSADQNVSSDHIVRDAFKVCGKMAMGAVVLAVALVAHPIIGPLGSLGSLFKAAYHGIKMKYHLRHTRMIDLDGKLLTGTELNKHRDGDDYLKNHQKFTVLRDLNRLNHELKRLYHLKAARSSLKWARGFAKSAVPVVGPFWAFFTELANEDSKPLGCMGCSDHWDHMTPEAKLRDYIKYGKYIEEQILRNVTIDKWRPSKTVA